MSGRRAIVELDPVRLPAASRLLVRTLGPSSYAESALESLELAAPAPGAEARALGCVREEILLGVIVFGTYAGAQGAGRIQLVVVSEASRRGGVARSLAEAAIEWLRGEHARFVLVELPDDVRALPGAGAFLAALGFREESRIENFFRDGVALSFMRRDLASAG